MAKKAEAQRQKEEAAEQAERDKAAKEARKTEKEAQNKAEREARIEAKAEAAEKRNAERAAGHAKVKAGKALRAVSQRLKEIGNKEILPESLEKIWKELSEAELLCREIEGDLFRKGIANARQELEDIMNRAAISMHRKEFESLEGDLNDALKAFESSLSVSHKIVFDYKEELQEGAFSVATGPFSNESYIHTVTVRLSKYGDINFKELFDSIEKAINSKSYDTSLLLSANEWQKVKWRHFKIECAFKEESLYIFIRGVNGNMKEKKLGIDLDAGQLLSQLMGLRDKGFLPSNLRFIHVKSEGIRIYLLSAVPGEKPKEVKMPLLSGISESDGIEAFLKALGEFLEREFGEKDKSKIVNGLNKRGNIKSKPALVSAALFGWTVKAFADSFDYAMPPDLKPLFNVVIVFLFIIVSWNIVINGWWFHARSNKMRAKFRKWAEKRKANSSEAQNVITNNVSNLSKAREMKNILRRSGRNRLMKIVLVLAALFGVPFVAWGVVSLGIAPEALSEPMRALAVAAAFMITIACSMMAGIREADDNSLGIFEAITHSEQGIRFLAIERIGSLKADEVDGDHLERYFTAIKYRLPVSGQRFTVMVHSDREGIIEENRIEGVENVGALNHKLKEIKYKHSNVIGVKFTIVVYGANKDTKGEKIVDQYKVYDEKNPEAYDEYLLGLMKAFNNLVRISAELRNTQSLTPEGEKNSLGQKLQNRPAQVCL